MFRVHPYIFSLFFVLSCQVNHQDKQQEHNLTELRSHPNRDTARIFLDNQMQDEYKYVAHEIGVNPLDKLDDSFRLRLWINYGLSPIDEMIEARFERGKLRIDCYEIHRNLDNYSKQFPPVIKFKHRFAYLGSSNNTELKHILSTTDFQKIKSQYQIPIPDTLSWTDGTLYYFESLCNKNYRHLVYNDPDRYLQYIDDKSLEQATELISAFRRCVDSLNLIKY